MAITLNKFSNELLTQTITLEGTQGTAYSVTFGGANANLFRAEPDQGTIGESGNVEVTITFAAPEATSEKQEFNASVTCIVGEDEQVVAIEAEVAAATANTGGNDDPVDPNTGGDDEPTTNNTTEEKFDFENAKANDFFSRKDVNGEVIRVFEEDYWPVDFVNVEPEKFAIMPGENITQDCMFGDTTIDIEAIEAAASSATTNTGGQG